MILSVPDLGAINGISTEGVAHFTVLGQLCRLLDELVIDLLMHKCASASHTALPHIGHAGLLGMGHCLVNCT